METATKSKNAKSDNYIEINYGRAEETFIILTKI